MATRQALDGTWAQYKADSGNFAARRNNFADAVDFVGWYHMRTADTLGVAKNDTYNLYLAYYMGWGGYKSGSWRSNASLQKYARDTDDMARRYAAGRQDCRLAAAACATPTRQRRRASRPGVLLRLLAFRRDSSAS